MDITILLQYSFIIVALGTVMLAISTGVIGTISVLKGQSLIGDVIGHASYPGIILAFVLIRQKNPVLLMAGAILAGVFAFLLIQLVVDGSKLSGDTTMAVVLSSMFGLGMVLKSHIQGNPKFAQGAQAGLANYIFGQAAYMLREDVIIIFTVSLISLMLFLLFFKEIKIHVFDASYAQTAGIRRNGMSILITLMTMALIAAGLKAVGAILISSMLITPAVIGTLWSRRYERVLWIAAASGASSALLGTVVSTLYKGMSTGPSIILVMSFIALFSVIFAPRGIMAEKQKRRKLRAGK